MIQMFVAGLMWVLVASLLIVRRRRSDRSITYASLAIAIAMTLNVDTVYSFIDPLMGGTNLGTLLSDALLMTGLFFLGRGVMRTGDYRPAIVRASVGAPAVAVSLLAITVTFFFIDRGTTTTQFMIDLGAQAATATYSIINFTYFAIVVTTMLALAVRQCAQGSGIQRVPAGVLSIGSAFGINLCVVVIVMDIAHVAGQLDLMRSLQPVYGALSLLSFLFLCAGFAMQPAVHRTQHYFRERRTRVLTTDLEPIWRRATAVRPGLSHADPTVTTTEDLEARLHREIVEIRDALIDPRASFDLAPAELALLQRAESHLLGLDKGTPEEPPRHVPRPGASS